MTKVLLFSGGLDSICYQHLCKPDVLLYCDNRSKYSDVELENIHKLVKKAGIQDKLKIVKTKDMSEQEQDNALILNRNLYFILEAAFIGSEIILGYTAGDNARDKGIWCSYLYSNS